MTNSLECLINDGPTRAIRFNFELYDEECLNVHIKVTYHNTHRCNADVARAVGTQLVGKIRRMQGALKPPCTMRTLTGTLRSSSLAIKPD